MCTINSLNFRLHCVCMHACNIIHFIFQICFLEVSIRTHLKFLCESSQEFWFFPLWISQLRFGKLNKDYSNTNVFEHSNKFYSVSENYIPQEIDIFTLNTLNYWDVNGAWNRPFASHPKVSFICVKEYLVTA